LLDHAPSRTATYDHASHERTRTHSHATCSAAPQSPRPVREPLVRAG
jgi:hypothetical protein